MPDFAVKSVFSAVDKISPAFRQMATASEKFERSGVSAMSKTNRAASALSGALRTIAPLVGIASIGALVNRSVELASSLTEVQNVVDTTFKDTTPQINAWSKNAITQFGLSELQAKKFTGSLGAMMKSSGLAGPQITDMSTRLVGLAGDFASFYNLDAETAFEKIRSGISGETEPLKQLGINMSVANMEAFALTQGITKQWKSMTQQEQTLLRYNYLMQNTTDAQGDFNKTLETSYANQKRVLSTKIDQKLAEIATKFLPSLVTGFKDMNSAIDGIDAKGIADGLSKVVGTLTTMAKIVWHLRYVILVFTATWAIMKTLVLATKFAGVIKMLFAFRLEYIKLIAAQWGLNVAMLANPITWIIMGIVALSVAAIVLYKNWDAVSAALGKGWDFIKEKVSSFLNFVLPGLKTVGGAIMTALLFPLNAIIAGVIKVLEIASKIPGIGDKFKNAANTIKEYQASANNAVGATNFFAPNQTEVNSRSQNNVNVNLYNANAGSTATVTPKKGATVKMERAGANR